MKKLMVLTSALMLTGALTACNANDRGAMDTRYNNDTRPIGYYSNDNNRGRGPMIADRDRTDLNMNEVNYSADYNGSALAQKIARKVNNLNNVDDARVVVTDDTVLVGVDTNDRNVDNIKTKVKNTVQKMTDKKVRVTTDEDMYTRIKNVDNNLRNGNGYGEVRSDVTGIINDLADAVKRPFQNNR